MKVKSPSRVQLLATPWTEAYEAPSSMGFTRPGYWSGLPLPSLGLKLHPLKASKNLTVEKKCDLCQTESPVMSGPLHQFFQDEFSVLSQAHSPATDISSALRRHQHRQPHPLSSRAVSLVIHAYQGAHGLVSKETQMAGIHMTGPPRALWASTALRMARAAFSS